jgi:Flp pilus assembly protein TadG
MEMRAMKRNTRQLKSLRSLFPTNRGTAALEFAFLLPVLIILAAGGYEFGRAFWHYHVVTKGVRDATRFLTRVPTPLAPDSTAIAENLVLRGSMDPAAPLLLDEWQADPGLANVAVTLDTFDNSAGTFRGPDGATANVDVVRVTATVLYEGTGLLALVGFPDGLNFRIWHEERHMGQ